MTLTFRILNFDSLDSTNSEILRQAKESKNAAGAKEGLVVIASSQTKGKGRLGRQWLTIDDALAMSVLLKPQVPTSEIAKISLVIAVAVHEALSHFTSEIGIKWPNDLLIQQKKVCGILTELQTESNGSHSVAVGIGINIIKPSAWEKGLRTTPTALNEHSSFPIDKNNILQAVLDAINVWYTTFLNQGFAPIREAWEKAHIATHKKVSVMDGDTTIQGLALGLADNGALRLLVNGEEIRIIAGDVSIMEAKT